MTRNKKYFITTAWIIFSRSFDAFCTHQHTPDLKKESNPLVSVFGAGWTPLLIVLVLLTAYSCYAFYLSTFKPRNLHPSEKGFSLSQFSAFTFLGKKDHWFAAFYQLPKQRWRFHQYMGQTLTPCLAYAGVVSTIMWLLIRYVPAYRSMHSSTLIYSLLLAGCAAILFQWTRKEYALYVKTV